MKSCSLTLFLFLALITGTVIAQVPQGIPYQAVARDTQGQPLASRSVKVRFSVLDSTATGNAVYVESHTATTSALGLFAVNVGMGTPVTGTFSGINWGVNSKFLKVELDTTGTGISYVELGTQQMMSVPYALYAGATTTYPSSSATLSIGSGFTSISNSMFSGTLMQTLNYCYNLVEAGYNDWRLPNTDEVFNHIILNGVVASNLNIWTVTNSSYNVLGPGGDIFPFTCFISGEIYVSSPYSVRNSRCVR